MAENTEIDRLLSKSKEAFALAVELYNRPTLKYHAESCSIFLCNAWELMLKAYLIREQGLESIYYPDNSEKTLALGACLKKVFTNDKDPLRGNMRELIHFRNTNTHFITDEYEIFYGPILQAAVSNYADKLMDLHDESVSDLMPENHLTLSVRRGIIDPDTIRARYEPHVAEQLLKRSASVADAVGAEGNTRIAAIYETNFRIVKRAKDADLNVYIDPDAEAGVTIVKDVKDSASYYPYTAKGCIDEVNNRLKKRKVDISYRGQYCTAFNQFHFKLFVTAYQLKGNDRYSYDRRVSNEVQSSWTYSQHTAEFIVEQLEKRPEHCLDGLKRKFDEIKKEEI